MNTDELIKKLKDIMPLGPISNQTLKDAADRLEELQRLFFDMTSQRDQARAQVEFIKESHAKCRQYLAEALDKLKNQSTEMTRPEPSRLEIAAMVYSVDGVTADIALKWADTLIAAAKKSK
jgi:chromosome segregation ATPase